MPTAQDTNVATQRILKEYSDRVKESDDKTRKQLDTLISNAITTFRFHLGVDIAIFFVGIVLLIFGLNYLFSMPNNSVVGIKEGISIGCAISGLLIMMIVLVRNPVQSLRQPIRTLTKVSVVFLGYTRQMRQVDAIFKQMIISSRDLEEDRINQISDNVHVALEEAIDQVNRSLEELD